MLSTVDHSYACSILRNNKIRIFSGGREILGQSYPLLFHKLTTSIKVGENFLAENEKNIKKIDSDYDYLKRIGWKISCKKDTGAFFDYQKIVYFICPINSHYSDYGSFPAKHYVLVDFNNKGIQFCGKNVSQTGKTPWFHLVPQKHERAKHQKPNPFYVDSLITYGTDMVDSQMPDWAKTETETFQQIPEAVFGITHHGEVCCIEKEKDAPVIAVAGQRGSGKSLLEHNGEGQFKHKLKYNIFNINDVKYDTQNRCMTWDKHHKFFRELRRFNETTIPLPYVYLHPTMKHLKDSSILYKDEVGFEVSFPFRNFLLDTHLMEYNEQWRTSPASMKYLRDLIEDNHGNERLDGLLYCKSLAEVKELIDATLPEELKSTSGASIFALIKDVWNRNILDKTSGIPSKWVAKISGMEFANSPWNICLLFGLVPCLITAYARREDWFPMFMRYMLDDVFEFKKSKQYKMLQDKQLMLCGDELVSILRNKQTRAIIDQVIREGRTDDIGMFQVVQHYSDIPESIITNITHHFVFNDKSKEDMSYLGSEFDLSKTEQADIGKLKRFQCMAFGDFILYDNNGGRYSNDGKPVKITKIKMPNAQHYGGDKNYEEED